MRLDGTVIDAEVVFMTLDYHDKRAEQFIARDAGGRKQPSARCLKDSLVLARLDGTRRSASLADRACLSFS